MTPAAAKASDSAGDGLPLNKGMEPTAYSVRSSVAHASVGGSHLALAANCRISCVCRSRYKTTTNTLNCSGCVKN